MEEVLALTSKDPTSWCDRLGELLAIRQRQLQAACRAPERPAFRIKQEHPPLIGSRAPSDEPPRAAASNLPPPSQAPGPRLLPLEDIYRYGLFPLSRNTYMVHCCTCQRLVISSSTHKGECFECLESVPPLLSSGAAASAETRPRPATTQR